MEGSKLGCGCGGGNKAAALAKVQQYRVEGDPENKQYLTESEATAAKSVRGLTGDVVPVQ
jgi:hypothetical protein